MGPTNIFAPVSTPAESIFGLSILGASEGRGDLHCGLVPLSEPATSDVNDRSAVSHGFFCDGNSGQDALTAAPPFHPRTTHRHAPGGACYGSSDRNHVYVC